MTSLSALNSELPDVLLSDIRMPDIDGLSLLKALKSNTLRCRLLS